MAYYAQDGAMNSIILAGIMLLVYESIMIVCFYFLSPVVMMILYSIFNSEVTLAYNGGMYASEFYFVTVAMFAVAFLIPVVWFILWVFRVEAGSVVRRV